MKAFEMILDLSTFEYSSDKTFIFHVFTTRFNFRHFKPIKKDLNLKEVSLASRSRILIKNLNGRNFFNGFKMLL